MMKKALVLSLSLGLVGNVSANNVDALVALAQAEGMAAVEQVIAQAAFEDEAEVNVIKKHKKLLLTVAASAAATAAVVVVGQMAYNSYKTPAYVGLANKIAKAAKDAKTQEEFVTAKDKILEKAKEEDKKEIVALLNKNASNREFFAELGDDFAPTIALDKSKDAKVEAKAKAVADKAAADVAAKAKQS